MKIVAQCLVRNEERWIWYALQSILDHVDLIQVWDDDSQDQTAAIIKSINSPKIQYRKIKINSPMEHTQMRQQMLDEAQADWILTLDGDEVWWQESIAELILTIRNYPNKAGIISPFINAVGDIYHFQDPRASHYRIHHYFGPYTIRAINRRLGGLHLANNPHGRQEYQTSDGVALQSLPLDQLTFVDKPFLHLTHLQRSRSLAVDRQTLKRSFKYRYELGAEIETLPEVFYLSTPAIIPDPWTRRSLKYWLWALWQTPLKLIKRFLFTPAQEGY